MRRENYKSDIALEVILTLGGVEVPVPDHDFALVFYTTGKRQYLCSHQGDKWDNCAVIGGRLHCYLDNHRLSPGTLRCEFFDRIPDANFADGDQLKVVPRSLDVELIYGAGDDSELISVEVATDVAAAVARANEIAEELEAKNASDYWRGVGIARIEQTKTSYESGGANDVTITLTNGYTMTFTIRNGGVELTNYYTKVEVGNLLELKADLVHGKIPAEQLPSMVDDVVEGMYVDGKFLPVIYNPSLDYVPTVRQITPEAGKLYVDTRQDKLYRWDGNQYVEVARGNGGGDLNDYYTKSQADSRFPTFSAVEGYAERKVLRVTIYDNQTASMNALEIANALDGEVQCIAWDSRYECILSLRAIETKNNKHYAQFVGVTPEPKSATSQEVEAAHFIVANVYDDASVVYKFTKVLIDSSTLAGALGMKQDVIDDLDSIRRGAELGATALQSFTESDPTVPAWAKESSKPSYNYSEITGTPSLAAVATSGSYNDLSNKPSIPDTAQMVTKSELASYNPIIEDERTSLDATIVGTAPFAELEDGQRIIIHFSQITINNSSIQLNLSSGESTGAIPAWVSSYQAANLQRPLRRMALYDFSGGSCAEFVYNETSNRWICLTQIDTAPAAMWQSVIDAGTSKEAMSISPNMLRGNFYLKSEVDANVSGKADKRVAVIKCDIEIFSGGSLFTAAELAAGLDTYYAGWRNDALLVAVYDNIVSNISNRTISGVTISDIGLKALATVGVELDTDDKGGINPNNVYANPTLGVNTYNLLGTTDAPAPTLPTNYDAADEFVLSFTCATDACVLTLPNGVKMSDGFDFERDRKAGAKFQVSIQDGIAGYLCLTNNNS